MTYMFRDSLKAMLGGRAYPIRPLPNGSKPDIYNTIKIVINSATPNHLDCEVPPGYHLDDATIDYPVPLDLDLISQEYKVGSYVKVIFEIAEGAKLFFAPYDKEENMEIALSAASEHSAARIRNFKIESFEGDFYKSVSFICEVTDIRSRYLSYNIGFLTPGLADSGDLAIYIIDPKVRNDGG